MPEIIAVVIRAAIAFFLLLLMTRLMGKTQLSQLNFFDYVVGITIGSTASTLATNTETPVVAGVTSILVWSGLAMAIDRLTLKNLYASKIIEGEPSVIIKNGKLMEEAMAKANYDMEELMTQLRNRGVFDLSQVEEAVLETNGQLSVLLKSQYRPVTPEDLNLDTQYEGMPQILVVDGNIARHRLAELELDEVWLWEQLRNLGINDLSEVMVAQLDTKGKLYVDKKSDWDGWK
ncbi:MAG: DUF421 domain-containing protein [Clostridia bacterium]|nr:DUF421 domain-containing protein [Clostridia bacterium]